MALLERHIRDFEYENENEERWLMTGRWDMYIGWNGTKRKDRMKKRI
jgi:hypothetical protein